MPFSHASKSDRLHNLILVPERAGSTGRNDGVLVVVTHI